MPALDDALATIGANLPEDVRQAHIRDRVVALANSAQATILVIEDVLPADPVQVGILVIEDVLPADPVQVGILVIEDVLPAESIPALAEAQQPTPEDLGAACVASDLPTEDAAAKLAGAGLDVVLPE